MIKRICKNCEQEFEADNNLKLYCPPCKLIKTKERLKRYTQSDKFKMNQRKYRQSEKGKVADLKKDRRYKASEHGKLAMSAYRISNHERINVRRAEWRSTPNGIASENRYRASKNNRLIHVRAKSGKRCQYPTVYTTTFERWMFEEGRHCSNCGVAWSMSHELDHVISLGYGRLIGIDNLDYPWNLQVLCKQCHIKKSVSDRKDILTLRKKLASIGLIELRRGK